jgi:hypothetical protein
MCKCSHNLIQVFVSKPLQHNNWALDNLVQVANDGVKMQKVHMQIYF